MHRRDNQKTSLQSPHGGRATRPALAVILAIAATTLYAAAAAYAEPLVVMEAGKAKPGVVTSWTGSGKKITLSVKSGVDAGAVAKTISDETGAKAKATQDKILVIGKTQEELLTAMAEIDFGGDLAVLAEASMKGGGFDSGSSLRAKKTADMAKLMQDRSRSLSGKIAAIHYGTFPEVVLEIRVIRPPTGELGKSIRKGATVKVRPLLKRKGSEVEWSDEHTQQNAGSWYLEKGDGIEARMGAAASKDGVFEGELVTR